MNWEAEDPVQVSVDSAGVVTGNPAGESFVAARFGDWMEDTVVVTVTPAD